MLSLTKYNLGGIRMLVKNHILPKNMLTLLSVEDTVKTALDKMQEGDFLSLPVVEGDKFVGYIMKAEIYEKFYHEGAGNREDFEKQSIEKFVESGIKALDPNDGIDEASIAIEKLNIPFLPAIDVDGNFLGILTHASIFKAFSDLFNLGKGRQLVVYIFNIPGQLSRLLNVFRKEGINVPSMVVMDAKVMGILKVQCRVEVASNEEFEELISKVEKEGFKTGEL